MKFEISCCSHILLLRRISRSVARLCPLPSPQESYLWKVSHCTFHTFLHRFNFSKDLGKRPLKNFAEVAEDTIMCTLPFFCYLPYSNEQLALSSSPFGVILLKTWAMPWSS